MILGRTERLPPWPRDHAAQRQYKDEVFSVLKSKNDELNKQPKHYAVEWVQNWIYTKFFGVI